MTGTFPACQEGKGPQGFIGLLSRKLGERHAHQFAVHSTAGGDSTVMWMSDAPCLQAAAQICAMSISPEPPSIKPDYASGPGGSRSLVTRGRVFSLASLATGPVTSGFPRRPGSSNVPTGSTGS